MKTAYGSAFNICKQKRSECLCSLLLSACFFLPSPVCINGRDALPFASDCLLWLLPYGFKIWKYFLVCVCLSSASRRPPSPPVCESLLIFCLLVPKPSTSPVSRKQASLGLRALSRRDAIVNCIAPHERETFHCVFCPLQVKYNPIEINK